MHATPTAMDFFLANFYPSGPFTCIFQKLSRVFPVLTVANTSSCVGPQNEISDPDHHRQLKQVPVLSARGIEIGSKTCIIVFLVLREIGLVYRNMKCVVLCWFPCEIFDRALRFETKRLVV